MESKSNGCITSKSNKKLTTEEFIARSKKVHGDKYDYSKSIYLGRDKKVCIICPKHGEFWQRADHHLSGFGYPHCSKSKMENNVCVELQKNGIQYIIQKDFPWLKYKNNLHIDIYLPEYNIAIECQGGQHFYPVDFYGGDEEYRMICERDKLKYDLCKKNGIRVLYYTDVKLEEYPYDVITDLDELIKRIKNY